MALVAQEIPKVGLVMEAVRVVRWLKNVGDTVTQGEPLVEVETEKSVVEIEATASGRLAEILVQVDQEASGRRPDRLDRVRRGTARTVRRRRRHAHPNPKIVAALARHVRSARRRSHPKLSGRTQARCRARRRSRRNCRVGTARARSARRCETSDRRAGDEESAARCRVCVASTLPDASRAGARHDAEQRDHSAVHGRALGRLDRAAGVARRVLRDAGGGLAETIGERFPAAGRRSSAHRVPGVECDVFGRSGFARRSRRAGKRCAHRPGGRRRERLAGSGAPRRRAARPGGARAPPRRLRRAGPQGSAEARGGRRRDVQHLEPRRARPGPLHGDHQSAAVGDSRRRPAARLRRGEERRHRRAPDVGAHADGGSPRRRRSPRFGSSSRALSRCSRAATGDLD